MSCTITIPSTGEIGSFDFLRVDYVLEARATTHPVELGAEVTDHVQVLPLKMVVEVFVTASPLSTIPDPFAIEDAVGFFERAVGQVATIVIDGEGSFSSMVLEGAPHSRTAESGRAFSLSFRNIRIASALSVTIPPRQPAPVAAVGAPTEAPLGQQSTTPGVPSSKLFDLQEAFKSVVGSL
jgi:hypothetical protein